MDQLKTILSNAIVTWILGIAGVWLATIGITGGSITEIVTGLVGLILAWVGHALGLSAAKLAIPPTMEVVGTMQDGRLQYAIKRNL